MHLSYNEYIAAGGKPGLTNWVKYNWLGDTTVIAAKNKYLVIKDLPTFHTSPDTSTFQIQAIRTNAKLVYGTTMNLATGRDIKNTYRATDITDSRVKATLAVEKVPNSMKWFCEDFINI